MNKSDKDYNSESSGLKRYLKKNLNSIVFLILLTVIVSIITYYRVLVQIDIGPISDSFDFLSNALVFAGQRTGYSDLIDPPSFLSHFSDIPCGLHFNQHNILHGWWILFIFGVVGLFILLKMRFNDFESFLGALLYATFPIVLTIFRVGFSDLASVSFSIWALYFTVLAIKNDSRFFYLSFPFFMFAFLTRYNTALLIFPILLYLLINKNKINFKQIIIGIAAQF